MRAKSTMLIALAAAAAACSQQEQNVASANNAAMPADVETLPADESSTTPSNELVNGADSGDVNTANAAGNGY